MRTIVAPISALVLRTIGARFGAHPTTYFVYQLFPETTRASGLSAKSVNLDNRVFSLSALMKWAFQLKADRVNLSISTLDCKGRYIPTNPELLW